jgi:acyl-coenzyme A synthetase/AMP-(fatty) acid ligase/acyl carrier protein
MKSHCEQQAVGAKSFQPSGTFVEFPIEDVETSISERFEKIVRLCGDRLAVKMGERSLTYDELNQDANRIAHAILKTRGYEKEQIGFLFEHGIDVIAVILGILKAGKTYVALNPSFPIERNLFIARDAKLAAIITNDSYSDLACKLIADTTRTINLNRIDEAINCANPALLLHPENLAGILYTSGSTGNPKGVVSTHRQQLRTAMGGAVERRIFGNDRLSLIHLVGFGSASTYLYQSLLNGASLFPFDVKTGRVQRMGTWIEETQLTVCHTPPALFRELAESLPEGRKFRNLRLITLSGAPVTRRDFELYKSITSEEAVLEIMMGSSEAGKDRLCNDGALLRVPRRRRSCWFSPPGKKILLLDDNGYEVGSGEIGEIAVKGRYITPHYWNNSTIAKAEILAEQAGSVEQIQATGDLGKMLSDGFVVHLGRKDLMVKVRGYRVNIEEVEAALLEHPGIKEAGVRAWEREPGEKYLAGYIVPRQESDLSVDAVREFLGGKLPDYMVPSIFKFMEALPLTNGKVERKALPAPGKDRPELSVAYVAPRSGVEKKLARIWSEVLLIDQVGVDDNFFDLGGHSLTASRVITRVIQAFRLELSVKALFDSPTVNDMAAVIMENQMKSANGAELAQMLIEVEAMTEEDARKEIAGARARISGRDGHE